MLDLVIIRIFRYLNKVDESLPFYINMGLFVEFYLFCRLSEFLELFEEYLSI